MRSSGPMTTLTVPLAASPESDGRRDAPSSVPGQLPRIHGLACHEHFIVEMRRGAAARVAGESDPLIALHALTMHDVDGVEVTVAALDVTPMIDDDDVAVAS